MATAVTSCQQFNPDTDCPRNNFDDLTCDELLTCMNHMAYAVRSGKSGVKGLKDRFAEQTNGPCGHTTNTWKNHDDQIRGQQDKLNDYTALYQSNCGDPPEDIMDWATKPRPQAADWAPAPGSI